MTEAILPGTAPTTSLDVLNVLTEHKPTHVAHHMRDHDQSFRTIRCTCQPTGLPFMFEDEYTTHLHTAVLKAIGGSEVRLVREYTVKDPEGNVWEVYTTTKAEDLIDANATRVKNDLPPWEIVTRVRTTRYGCTVTDWEPVPRPAPARPVEGGTDAT